MRCAVVVNVWKLPFFEKVFDEAEYEYDIMDGPVPDTLLLAVDVSDAGILKLNVERASKAALRARAH